MWEDTGMERKVMVDSGPCVNYSVRIEINGLMSS